MIRSIFTILLLLVLPGATAVSADAIRDPDTYFFHQSFGDLQEEAALAADQNLFGVMVMFEANDCPWCERMKRHVLNQSAVQDYFRDHFRILTVNVNGDTPIVDFSGTEIIEKDFALQHNRIRATPTFLFFDSDGRLATKYTGAAKDVQEFMWLGEFVIDGHYRDGKFTQFKRARREATE